MKSINRIVFSSILLSFFFLAVGCNENINETNDEALNNNEISSISNENTETEIIEATSTPTTMSSSEESLEQEVTPQVADNNETNDVLVSTPLASSGVHESSLNETGQMIKLNAQNQTFSLQNSQRTTPEDVLRELSYSGGFGGGGSPCDGKTFDAPTILLSSTEGGVEWLQRAGALTCGWRIDEPVQVVFRLPNEASIINETINAYGNGEIEFSYEIPLNFQPGQYELKFIGEQTTLDVPIEVIFPQEARLYFVDNQLIFYNFSPDERVRILAYEPKSYDSFDEDYWNAGYTELIAWDEYQVDQDGQLIIDVSDIQNETIDFIILGDASGEFQAKRPGSLLYGSALSPYVVKPLRPNENQTNSVENLWSQTRYVDLELPGTQRYEIDIDSDKSWIWSFSWCAANENILEEILSPLSVLFYIEEDLLNSSQLRIDRYEATDGWECQSWKTLLENWPEGENVMLEIKYSLREEIYDGSQSYPPGEYSHVFNVLVNP